MLHSSNDSISPENQPIYVVDGTAKMLPEARVEFNTPYYSGLIMALCMAEPLYDLILGNIKSARAPDDPKEAVKQPIGNKPAKEEAVAAVVMHSQARNQPQKVPNSQSPRRRSTAAEQELRG